MAQAAKTTNSDVCLWVTAVFIPFVPILIKVGPTAHFWINLALCGFILFPIATIHAWWVLYTLSHPSNHPDQVADIQSKGLPVGPAGAGAGAGAGAAGVGKAPSRAPTAGALGAKGGAGAPLPAAGAGAADPADTTARDDLLTPSKRSPTGADPITKAGIPVSKTGSPAEKADPLDKPVADTTATAGGATGAGTGAGAGAGADADADPAAKKGALAKTGTTADDTLAKA